MFHIQWFPKTWAVYEKEDITPSVIDVINKEAK